MQTILHSSAGRLAEDRHDAPDQWRDLKRDWRRWSRTERIAAECIMAVMLIGGALAFVLTSTP